MDTTIRKSKKKNFELYQTKPRQMQNRLGGNLSFDFPVATENSLSEILSALGYEGPNWITDRTWDEGDSFSFRLAKEAGIEGAYLFKTNSNGSAKPAVMVAAAQDESDVISIQKKIWNLGVAPFLLVVLPSRIQLYSAFSFNNKYPKKSLLEQCGSSISEIKKNLIDFAAESIDDGSLWSKRADDIHAERRVDKRLLSNLKSLSKELQKQFNITPTLAHSLIGKTLYIRYLRDRDILSDQWLLSKGVEYNAALGPVATVKGYRALEKALENQFGGNIFQIHWINAGRITDTTIEFIASVFNGTEASGQLSFSFLSYDFKYIPIELLSSIYEHFLRETTSVKKTGAYYTPEHLAHYVIAQANRVKRLEKSFKILDPSCGSGVFLVTAYKQLIELHKRSKRSRLTPSDLRAILTSSIFGVERDPEACMVAEFSLILCLLSYIEPPELHRNGSFKFPVLTNSQIYNADFFDSDSDFNEHKQTFDWIVGNPPWVELDPLEASSHYAVSWINEHYQDRPVDRYQACEAFAWRVLDFAANTAAISMLLSATVLMNDHALKFRKAFFSSTQVRSISNFSNLASVLFEGRAGTPALSITYTRTSKASLSKNFPITHFGPFLVNQVARSQKKIWAIGISESEIKTVPYSEARTGKAETWIMALWGTHRDQKALQQLRHALPLTVNRLINKKKWKINQGLQLKSEKAKSKFVPIDPPVGIRKLLTAHNMTESGCILHVPDLALKRLPSPLEVREGRYSGLEIVRAPHLVIKHNFSPFSDKDFIVPHPIIAVSASEEDSNELRALSMYFNSNFCKYIMFFSTRWGITRGDITLSHVKQLPVPAFRHKSILSLARVHRELCEIEAEGQINKKSIQRKIDSAIASALNVNSSTRAIVQDFFDLREDMKNGKVDIPAVEYPNDGDFRRYASTLSESLGQFSGIPHEVIVERSPEFSSVSIRMTKEARSDVIESDKTNADILNQLGKEMHSQWTYVQKSFRALFPDRLFLIKPNRKLEWSRTQALLDSDSLIAEALNG